MPVDPGAEAGEGDPGLRPNFRFSVGYGQADGRSASCELVEARLGRGSCLLGVWVGVAQHQYGLSLAGAFRYPLACLLVLPVSDHGAIPFPIGQYNAVVLDLVSPDGHRFHRLPAGCQALPGRYEDQALPRQLEDVVPAPRQSGQQVQIELIGLVQVGQVDGRRRSGGSAGDVVELLE